MRSRSKVHPDRRRRAPRPTASLVVALIALLVALAGTGWAASRLSPNSVGTKQLRDAAVTSHKLARSAVGHRQLKAHSVGSGKLRRAAIGGAQVDVNQVQTRVTRTCSVARALSSVTPAGAVDCNATLPQAYDRGSSTIRLTAARQLIAGKRLASGTSFLLIAYPEVTVKGSVRGQDVEVGCTLAVIRGNGAARTGTLRFEIGHHLRTQAATIPLVLAVTGAPAGSSAEVRCGDSVTPSTAAPKVSIKTTVDAIQT